MICPTGSEPYTFLTYIVMTILASTTICRQLSKHTKKPKILGKLEKRLSGWHNTDVQRVCNLFEVDRGWHKVDMIQTMWTSPVAHAFKVLREWHTPNYHICLCHHQPVPCETGILQIALHLAKGKLSDMHFMGDTVVKSSVAVDDVSHHPRCRRATDDEHQVLLQRSPAVPEISQCRLYSPRILVNQLYSQGYQCTENHLL